MILSLTSRRIAALWLIAIGIVGCGSANENAAAVADTSTNDSAEGGIAWYPGSVDAAFMVAADTSRPVFLFWGATWCPYCQQLKSSVFTRREFIEKSRLFVPVYLDGDDPGAQRWGEQLGISGYPTVLILAPDRTELMRVAGGMDVERYSEILDLALNATRPVEQILAAVRQPDVGITLDDCRRLAYNGWGLDPQWDANAQAMADALVLAADRCPADANVERTRLLAIASEASPGPKQVQGVLDALKDVPLSVAVADTLFPLDDGFFAAARELERISDAELYERWTRVMQAAGTDDRYSPSDQLFAYVSWVRVARALGRYDDSVASAVRTKVTEALAASYDAYTRASVVNASLHVFDALEDEATLYAVAEKELNAAESPYYYMPTLAAIEEQRGNITAAIGWLERAYAQADGPATRFQWGTSYVMGLVRMQPENSAVIERVALEVLGELEGPERLYQRTQTRLERLDAALMKWNEGGAHDEVIAALRERMQPICGSIAATETKARTTCSRFLNPA